MVKPNAPTASVWWIAIVFGFLGIIAEFVAIPEVTTYRFWFVTVGFVLLFLSTLLKKF